MATVAILSGNSTVQAVKDLGYNLVSINESVSLSSALLAEHVLEIDLNDWEDARNRLADLHRRFPIDGILTNYQRYTLCAAYLAESLGIRGLSVQGAQNCNNKLRMRRTLNQHGVSVVQYGTATDVDEALSVARRIGYPVVIKPVEGGGSEGVRFCENEAALREEARGFFGRLAGRDSNDCLLIEEFLDGPQFTVDAILRDGQAEIVIVNELAVGGYPSLVSLGYRYPPRVDPQVLEQIRTTVLDAFPVLGMDYGNAHVEIRLTDRGPKIIEVNPRAPGGRIREVAIAVTGIDIVWEGIASVAGKQAPRREPVARYALVKDFIADQGGILRYRSGLFSADVEDPESMVKHPLIEMNVPSGEEVAPFHEEPGVLGRIVVLGQTEGEVSEKMDRVLKELDFCIEPAGCCG